MRACLVRTWCSLLVIAVLAAPVFGVDQGPQSTAPSAAFPVDTVFHLSTAKMAEFSAAWVQTAPGKTLMRPAVAAYRQRLEKEEIISALALRPLFGVDWTDLAQVSGKVTLAVCPVSAQTLEVVLAVDSGPKDPAVAACQDSARAYWKKRGFQLRKVSVSGRPVDHYRREREGRVEERWMATTPQGFLVATGTTSLPKLLAGPVAPVQAPSAEAQPADGKPADGKPDASAGLPRCLLRVRPLTWARHLESKQSTPARGVHTAERLGFAQVDDFQGEAVLDPNAVSMIRLEGTLGMVTSLEKAARLLDFPTGAQARGLPVAADGVDTVGSWRWDFPTAMSGLGNVLDEWMEPGPDGEGLFEDLLDGIRDDPDGPQVNLRRELFERIGPRVVALGGYVNPNDEHRRVLFVSECRDRQAVRDTLTRMYRNDEAVHFEDLSGHGVWWVEGAGSLFIDAESAEMPTARAVAIGPKGFLLSTDATFLRDYLRGDATGPAETWNRLSQEAAKYQDGEIGAQALVLTKQRFEDAYRQLGKGKAPVGLEQSLLAAFWLGSAVDPASRPNGLKLPEFTEIQGLFAPAWTHCRKDGAAMLLRSGFLSEVAR